MISNMMLAIGLYFIIVATLRIVITCLSTAAKCLITKKDSEANIRMEGIVLIIGCLLVAFRN